MPKPINSSLLFIFFVPFKCPMVLSMVSISMRVRVRFFSRTWRCDLRAPTFLEFSLAQNLLDALQLEAQFSVKEDLLEHQQLWLFVDSVAVRLSVGGLQQRYFIEEMKRPHGDARHHGQLFDGVSHRFCLVPVSILQDHVT